MTDFLGNLILRSTGDSSPLSILQPRLPSLFEPTGGGTEMPELLPDPDVRNPTGRNTGFWSSTTSIDDLPARRSTITAAPGGGERMPGSIEKRVAPDPQAPARSQTAQVVFSMDNPQRTILPRTASQAVQKESTGMEDRRSLPSNEPVSMSPAAPRWDNARKADMVSASLKKDQEEPLPVESARRMEEPASQKAGLAPVILQPALTVPGPGSRQPFEQKQAQAPQQVVEIHIGRVEVRAVPPSTPPKRAAGKKTMSLEEYLHKRPGER